MAFFGPVEIWYFSVFYLLLVTRFGLPVLEVLAVLGSLMLYEAWGVLLNDIFDREVDIVAGKSGRKRGHDLGVGVMWGLVLLTAVASWALIVLAGGTPLLYGTWAFAYVLGFLYSTPPFRLKDRGTLSLFCNSVLERPLPVLIIFLFFRYYGPEAVVFPILSELVWSVFKHQVHDYHEDLKANVKTYAVKIGEAASHKIVKFVVNPLSVASVLSFALIAARTLPQYSGYFLAGAGMTAAGVAGLLVLERRSLVYTDPLDPPYILFLNLSFLVTVVLLMGAAVVVTQPAYFPPVALFLLSLVPHMRYYGPMVPRVLRKVSRQLPARGRP